MRICSLFSSATELLCALGAGRAIVGRSERCDYPPSIRRAPIVVRSRIASDRLSSRGIHEAVEALRTRGEHQYDIDVALLKRLKPDLVITQELCNVCAAGHPEVLEAVERLQQRPRTIAVSARRFEELFESIRTLGQAIGRTKQASALSAALRRQVDTIRHRVKLARTTPRVWCSEWLEPLMAAGHWIPEMAAMAGGTDTLGRPGEDSAQVAWDEVRRDDPEVIIVMPCSFSMARTVKEFPLLTARPGWTSLSAVKAGRVFAVNTAFFHRPGPRLVKGLGVMAALFHPEQFPALPTTHARALLKHASV
ncbi:MAG: cobalamin-binding protein [Candidatus Omnitrophica bacterium]|nr:cobalamin-binding protein [Candidatus Omnitrophota bacterium]